MNAAGRTREAPSAQAAGKVTPLRSACLSSPEEIIEEAKNGRMFILVDDEDRENEGDLVIPAQMATPEKLNFMAKHGRGLICLAITKSRVDELGLDLMSRNNGTRHETAFTVSIEAREGVTTGISVADRARTVAVAIDATKSQHDLVTPGHVFPLVAREGGVLVRAGHTEAAVDIARLAGLNPSGVICEIMNEDGTMARLDALIAFAQLHSLKIGTIRDLIAFRCRNDHLIEVASEASFASRWGGDWTVRAYRNKATGTEQIALVKGRIDPCCPTLVRMHALNPFGDMFGEDSSRGHMLSRSMEMIAEQGSGVVVVINRDRADAFTTAVKMKAGEPIEFDMEELRDYGVGAMILADLGVHDMVLLTNTHHSLVGLEGHGLRVIEERAVEPAARSRDLPQQDARQSATAIERRQASASL
jgi:3,4-dihydroxy 2-butanone 4-phosphate synthase/GTP cyclohydrolase II